MDVQQIAQLAVSTDDLELDIYNQFCTSVSRISYEEKKSVAKLLQEGDGTFASDMYCACYGYLLDKIALDLAVKLVRANEDNWIIFAEEALQFFNPWSTRYLESALKHIRGALDNLLVCHILWLCSLGEYGKEMVNQYKYGETSTLSSDSIVYTKDDNVYVERKGEHTLALSSKGREVSLEGKLYVVAEVFNFQPFTKLAPIK